MSHLGEGRSAPLLSARVRFLPFPLTCSDLGGLMTEPATGKDKVLVFLPHLRPSWTSGERTVTDGKWRDPSCLSLQLVSTLAGGHCALQTIPPLCSRVKSGLEAAAPSPGGRAHVFLVLLHGEMGTVTLVLRWGN